jgi:hypothetical protein
MAVPPKSVVARVRQLMQTRHVKGAQNRAADSPARSKVPLDEFVAMLYEEGGSAYKLAKRLGMAASMVAQRRAFIETSLGIELPRGRPEVWKSQAHRQRININLDSAEVLFGSDLHAWPEIYGVAMAAMIDFNRRHKPAIVVLNGDGLDGAQISKHSRLGWDKRPSPQEEIEALSEYLDQLRKANPNARYIRTRGNHDTRLETYLASNAPLVEGMKGTTLADHIPGWEECISIHFNVNEEGLDPELIAKHRGRHNGLHATFNELRALGVSFCHGHLHAQKLVSYENARGAIWGVDLGMLAPKDHPGFDYTEDGIPNWRSGLGLFTFQNAKLEIPELATVTHEGRGEMRFRGKTLRYEL